jgi:hypothetical protein
MRRLIKNHPRLVAAGNAPTDKIRDGAFAPGRGAELNTGQARHRKKFRFEKKLQNQLTLSGHPQILLLTVKKPFRDLDADPSSRRKQHKIFEAESAPIL